MRGRGLFAAAMLLALGAGAAPMTVGAMKCEYRINPQGIDVTLPRLSWELQSKERGVVLSAYQMLVASTPEQLAKDTGDLWDSGKVASDQSTQVPYAGKPLASEKRCYWKLRVWNAQDEASAWSETAKWSMGLLKQSDWLGKWIGLDGGEGESKLVYDDIAKASWIWFPGPSPAASAPAGNCWFRTMLVIPGGATIQSAVAHVGVDNWCEMSVNGDIVGSTGDFKQTKEFDIAAKLHSGGNVIAVEAENAGDGPNPAGLVASIVVRLNDGSTQQLISGDGWRVTDKEQADWAKPGCDDSKWSKAQVLGGFDMAPWTGGGKSDNSRLAARMLRREFEAKKAVVRATVSICGLGLFELHLNGSKVGNDVLVPGQTEFKKRVLYMTYDVTDRVKEGRNAVGVMLGNGRFYAPRFTQPTATNTFGYPKMMFQMRTEYADGTSETLVSDAAWKLTTKGPVQANNEYDGEEYDARLEMPGWDAPGFDDSAWETAKEVAGPGGVLSAQMAEPIRVMEIVKPVAVKQPKPGTYVYDMGQNMVGWCRLSVQGPEGTEVKLRFAETIKDDGSLYLDNIRGAKVTDLYTLKGGGGEVYTPRFTYHGFRYVEVTGYPGEPTLAALEGQVVHDAVAEAGSFGSSNPLVNRIHKNIYWGTRGNYRSFPTDCPQRDERQGWLGDRSAECKGESYLFDIAALYGKWVGDMEDGQRDDGSVSDVCPTYWPLYNDNVTWPSTFVIAPDMLYTQYGDTRVIERHYDGMKKWIEHMRGYMKDDLIAKDNYGDWCVPPEEKTLIHSKEEKRKTPAELLASSYFIYDVRLMAKYAGMLKKDDDRAAFAALADRMTAAFNKKFWDADKGYFGNGSETSQVLPLAFGIAPEASRGPAFKYLADKIMNEGNGHLATGLIGGQWLMRLLSDNGRADIVYTMASKEDYPSWGYMISKDATTIWELWNGDTADPAMNSHNHVMLVGDLGIWFYEYLGGIQADPLKPGFKHVVMKPHPVGDLKHVSAMHQSLHGLVSSEWNMDGGNFVWRIQIPANTSATVSVPVQGDNVVEEGGAPAETATGVKFLRRDEGYAIYEVGSGSYTFVTDWK
jgi:alpha-L-rhamnosidase